MTEESVTLIGMQLLYKRSKAHVFSPYVFIRLLFELCINIDLVSVLPCARNVSDFLPGSIKFSDLGSVLTRADASSRFIPGTITRSFVFLLSPFFPHVRNLSILT